MNIEAVVPNPNDGAKFQRINCLQSPLSVTPFGSTTLGLSVARTDSNFLTGHMADVICFFAFDKRLFVRSNIGREVRLKLIASMLSQKCAGGASIKQDNEFYLW